MGPQVIAEFLAFGVFGGIIGGLLGVGGAIGVIPLATIFLAPDKQQLQGAAMLCNIAVAGTAYVRYRRAGRVDWTNARRIVPAALVAVLAGVGASLVVDASLFRVMFACFLAVVAVREFRLLARGHEHSDDAAKVLTTAHGAAIGGIMGFLSGLLGIGGGVVGVPLMRAWAHLPMKRAVVTSVCSMLPLAVIGAATKCVTLAAAPADGHANALMPALEMAACIAPGAIVGSWVGASVNVRVTGKAVRWVLASYLPVAAAWMAWPVVSSWLAGHR